MSAWGSGQLPTGWVWVALGALGQQVSRTTTPDPTVRYELWSVPAFPSGKPEEVEGRDVGSAKVLVEPGDVLVCKINPRINRVWTVGPNRGLPQIASTEWVVLRPAAAAGDQASAFLRYACTTPGFRSVINAQVSSVTGSHARAKPADVLSAPVPLAPVEEQRRIVAVLEEQLSQLDQAAADTAKLHVKLQALRDALLSRFMPAGGEATKSVGEMASVGSGATPLKSEASYYDGGTIPWVTSADLNAGVVTAARQYITDKALQRTAVKLWPAGTLLVAMYGEGQTRGRCARLDISATTNQACAAILLKDDAPVLSDFLHLFFDASYMRMRRLAAGGVQPNLSLGLIRGISVPIRPLTEQQQLVSETRAALESLDVLRGALRAMDVRQSALRRSIITAAYNGGLTKQEPSDEAAELLMKRIAEESAFARPAEPKRASRTIRPTARSVGTPLVEEST